jgi:hypothetical protein
LVEIFDAEAAKMREEGREIRGEDRRHCGREERDKESDRVVSLSAETALTVDGPPTVERVSRSGTYKRGSSLLESAHF